MQRLQPKLDKYNEDYDVYREKLDQYYKSDNTEVTEKPQPPVRPQTPDKPYAPRDPRVEQYGYSRYNSRPEGRSKKFTMQVRSALASGVPLAPEIEAQLVGLNTQLLIKYGAAFHPGQPWEPLAQTILKKVGEKGKVDKDAVDYAAKFVKGRWEPLEPYLLNKLFLVTNNMENMRTCLDYAFRAYRQRWPEFEDKIAKAKPGAASGYGAAQYAIRVLKKPWSAFPDIKRKKNGKINAEECMIVGNPGEARVYAEAFNSGKSWDAFEESALAANNLAALINYAEGQNRRMPELEEKILSGERDAQESKGRQRHRQHTDLPLDYSLKVIKGRWPEYEAKILEAINKAPKSTGYNSGEYKPSHGEYGYGEGKSRLDKRIQNYIKQVIKGRWPDAEQALLARYSEYPGSWSTNQDLVDGYLVIINKACQERHKDDEEVPEPEGNEAVRAEGQHAWQVPKRKDERRQKPFTKFQQDVECYWPEGESRLITRDAGYEKILVDELRRRAVPTNEADKNSYTKEEKYVSIEDLATMERPGGDISYEEKEKKPSYTIWNGIWIGWYGMDTIEKYVDYMLANGQTWDEGVDIMEIAEDLEDIRGRWSHNSRPLRRPEQKAEQKAKEEAEMMQRTREMHGLSPTPVQSSAERFQQRFSSSLLRKKALIDMEPSPSMLPPRDDLKGHMDQQMHDQMTKEVMKGVREPLNPKKKNRRPQINPLINPDGMVASAEDEKSEVRIRFRGKEEVLSSYKPEDIMKAIRHVENLSMANPGFPVVFILEEAGITSEDTYINGNHVGETVEKFSAKKASMT